LAGAIAHAVPAATYHPDSLKSIALKKLRTTLLKFQRAHPSFVLSHLPIYYSHCKFIRTRRPEKKFYWPHNKRSTYHPSVFDSL